MSRDFRISITANTAAFNRGVKRARTACANYESRGRPGVPCVRSTCARMSLLRTRTCVTRTLVLGSVPRETASRTVSRLKPANLAACPIVNRSLGFGTLQHSSPFRLQRQSSRLRMPSGRRPRAVTSDYVCDAARATVSNSHSHPRGARAVSGSSQSSARLRYLGRAQKHPQRGSAHGA